MCGYVDITGGNVARMFAGVIGRNSRQCLRAAIIVRRVIPGADVIGLAAVLRAKRHGQRLCQNRNLEWPRQVETVGPLRAADAIDVKTGRRVAEVLVVIEIDRVLQADAECVASVSGAHVPCPAEQILTLDPAGQTVIIFQARIARFETIWIHGRQECGKPIQFLAVAFAMHVCAEPIQLHIVSQGVSGIEADRLGIVLGISFEGIGMFTRARIGAVAIRVVFSRVFGAQMQKSVVTELEPRVASDLA